MFSIKKLSKSFCQGSQDLILLEQISYEFAEGHSYAIMGSSGSGKSTLLYMLMGVEQPDSGTILVDGIDVVSMSKPEKDELRRSLGVMFQRPYLVPELTVLENVMLKAILHGSVSEEDKKRAEELLCSVGLGDKKAAEPRLLSGGEQQRVALLRALFYPPKWLLIDEPTGSLDEQSGKEILELLKQYQSVYNMGIIMTTHDASVAQSMDHVVYIKNKKLEQYTNEEVMHV
jgi:ABC-type lipoprotein export system ATPase subunit